MKKIIKIAALVLMIDIGIAIANQSVENYENDNKTESLESKKNQEIIEGDVFLYPKDVQGIAFRFFELQKVLGFDVQFDENSFVVEVWAHSDISHNWARHGHPLLKEKDMEFPDWLPLEMFKGKKEGDNIEFYIYNPKKLEEKVLVKLHLKQGSYKYASSCGNGKFEECLRHMKQERLKKLQDYFEEN